MAERPRTRVVASPDVWEEWIARLGMIPAAHREFVIDLRRAELEFGLEAALVRELIAGGLLSVDGDDGPLLAALDLHYIGVRLGCADVYLTIMRGWAQALVAASERPSTRMEVRCMPYAGAGTDVDVLVPPGRRVRVQTGPDRVAVSFDTCLPGRWPALDPALDDLCRDVASLDFCWIPETLHEDVELVRRTGLSDCASASHVMAQECERRGIQARTAFGLLLAPPYSTAHNWVEVLDGDGCWIPADPLLLALLARFAGLDTAAWPPSRSPGAVLLRLADRETRIVCAGGEPLDATFLTRPCETPVESRAGRPESERWDATR